MKSVNNILVKTSPCHSMPPTQSNRTKMTRQNRLSYRKKSKVCHNVRSDPRDVPAPWQDGRRRLAAWALCVVVALAVAAAADAAAAAPRRAGLMKLCPPGGESFTSAWQMACGMRRRKKRDTIEAGNGTVFAIPSAGQHEALQAVVGLAISDPEPLAKSRAGDVEAAGGTRRKRAAAASQLKALDSNYYAYSNEIGPETATSQHYEPFAPSHRSKGATALVLEPAEPDVGLNLLGGKKISNPLPNTVAAVGSPSMIPFEMAEMLAELNGPPVTSEEAKLRAPSISEVMVVCCRYGCSLRDLLPYCSPFGDWDSYY